MSKKTRACTPTTEAQTLTESFVSVCPRTVLCKFYLRQPVVYIYSRDPINVATVEALYDVGSRPGSGADIHVTIFYAKRRRTEVLHRHGFWYTQMWAMLNGWEAPQKRIEMMKECPLLIARPTNFPTSGVMMYSKYRHPVRMHHKDSDMVFPGTYGALQPGWTLTTGVYT